jgi:hypothetical protein
MAIFLSVVMCRSFGAPMAMYQRVQAVLYGVLALLQLLFMHWSPQMYQHLRFKVRGSSLLYAWVRNAPCQPFHGQHAKCSWRSCVQRAWAYLSSTHHPSQCCSASRCPAEC